MEVDEPSRIIPSQGLWSFPGDKTKQQELSFYSDNSGERQYCPTVYEVVAFSMLVDNSANIPGGWITLDRPLYGIVAFQVAAFMVNSPSGVTLNSSQTIGLYSDTLSQNIKKPRFVVANLHNTGSGVATAITSLVGLSFGGNASVMATNQSVQVDPTRINTIQKFGTPQTIDRFNWSWSLLNNTALSFAQPYSVDVVLYFYPKEACKCPKNS